MMWGITGTPGTGKTSTGDILAQRGYHVVYLTDTVEPYQVGKDAERDTMVIDVERWAEEFSRVDGIVEGHLAHYSSLSYRSQQTAVSIGGSYRSLGAALKHNAKKLTRLTELDYKLVRGELSYLAGLDQLFEFVNGIAVK